MSSADSNAGDSQQNAATATSPKPGTPSDSKSVSGAKRYRDTSEMDSFLDFGNDLDSTKSPAKRVSVLEAASEEQLRSNLSSSNTTTSLDNEDSFLDVLQSFADLKLPAKEESRDEECPVCAKHFALPEFAPHVMVCIRKLDADEARQLQKLDRKVAEKLAGGTEQDFSKFRKPTHCTLGSKCTRTDQRHFLNLHHPDVPCPICNNKVPMYSMNQHVERCLKLGPNAFSFLRRRKTEDEDPLADTFDEPGGALQGSGGGGEAKTTSSLASTDLSLGAICAISSYICDRRDRRNGPEEANMREVLDTFRSLGVTHESLSDRLRAIRAGKNNENGGGSSGSMASGDNNDGNNTNSSNTTSNNNNNSNTSGDTDSSMQDAPKNGPA